jgi:O-antigen/teichoic acid export membrane protein
MRLAARLASQSAVLVAMRLGGAGIVFVFQAAMARLWGAALLGHYLLVIAVVNLLAALMPLGFQIVATYFAADYRAQNNGATLRAFALRAYGHIAIVTVVAALAGPIALAWLGGGVLTTVWTPTVIAATATALVFVNGALLVGLKRPLLGFLADTLCRPLMMAVGFVLALDVAAPGSRLVAMMWIAGLAYGAVALVHAALTWRTISRLPVAAAPLPADTRRWWRFALPWVVIALATDFFFDLDLMLLSKLMPIDDIAVFGVCARMFSLVAFGVSAVYAVMMPDMFEAEARGDRVRFHRRIADANLIATAFAASMSCAALFARPVLELFGPSFAAGASPLAILCLGLTVRSLAGPAALVLSIHDRPAASLPPVALGLAILVLGNALLVPRVGLNGATAAAALAMAVWSAAQWLTTWRHTALDVSIWPRLRDALGRMHQ